MNKNLKDNLVVQSNEIVLAKYAMTVNEQRLLLACISQLDSRKVITADDEITLTVEQARDLFYSKESERNAYRDLKDASEKLWQREARMDEGDIEHVYRFLQYMKFDQQNGMVTLQFASKIIPHLSGLQKNFTQYKIERIAQLRSGYAVRLYEVLLSFIGQNQDFKEWSIEEFRELLGTENKYSQFHQFKIRVIDLAVKQINEKTDMVVEWKPVKKKRGKAFTHLQFSFAIKPEEAAKAAIEKEVKKAKRERNQQAKAKRERNQQAKAKRERQAAIKEQQTIAKSAKFPPDSTFIKIDGTFAQMEGKTAVYMGENDKRYTIPEAVILQAIKDGRLEIVSPDDEKLAPLLDDNGNLDLFGF